MGERRIELVPLREIRRAPANPKQHRDDIIAESIESHGYAEPILVDDRTGRVVAGHGRLDTLVALRAAGKPPPEGVTPSADDWLVPVVRGWASQTDEQAEAYLHVSNEATIAGGWDEAGRAQLLERIAASPRGLVGTDVICARFEAFTGIAPILA